MQFNFCPNCGKQGTVAQQSDKTTYICSACDWHFWNNAKGSVFVVLVRGDTMLVSQRANEPNKGKYDLPGGFVDFGEDAYSAAIREAKEELGITIEREDLELIEVYHNQYTERTSTIDVGFLVRKWQGEIMLNDEVTSVVWKPLSFIRDPEFCEPFYTDLDKLLAQKLTR